MKLNSLIASVRCALLDDRLRKIYGERIQHSPSSFNWIKTLDNESFDNFFTDFAGQARVRWHYGVAHPLLCSFEDSFMADRGRPWLPEDNANPAKIFVGAVLDNPLLRHSEDELQDVCGEHIDPTHSPDQS